MEARLFKKGTVPEYCTAAWYADRDSAPHVDEALHRPRLDLAATFVRKAASGLDLHFVSDLGAGDGGLLSLIKNAPNLHSWGYDLQPSNVAAAALRGVQVELGDVLAKDFGGWGEIAVCTEMLEHLVDPHAFVRRIWANCKVLVASSPWSETAEDHYGYHTWAWDMDGYREMLEGAGWIVKKHQTTSMFQVVLAVAS